ncbi:NAD(P)-binding domain-containing protein [Chryseobacterium sp.]|uniref:NADPH-dependent F420 reductase n=1 Tax=Chryseobacterium sp. TaxID=1871047 RepID=UPI0025B8762D|nr:NAD(P)-binding domain-containing protein [Chryseobacterium sp.]
METKKTAIIGLGNIGQAVAGNLSKSDRNFIIADRNIEKAKELSGKWGKGTVASDIPSAVKNADILILSIPFEAIGSFLQEYSTDLEGKIIVDPSNPIAPDANGGFKKIIGNDESAGAINASFLPKGAKLVKALGSLSAGTLVSASYHSPERAVLFYATDHTEINADIEQLIQDNGFDALRIGGIDQSIRIEVFGDLHEFGALGKTVNLSEARQKI